MPRFVSRLAALGALSLAISCNPVAPSNPGTSTTPLTETFTALLTTNGADVFPFTEVNAGTVTATLATISPDSGLSLELDLGTWNGATCALVLTTAPAVQGSTVTGTANAAGNLCVRIADANGIVPSNPENITVSVSHF